MESQVEVDDYFLVLEDWYGTRGCWEVAKAINGLSRTSIQASDAVCAP
jgi:hypothetical protein